jgi:hypothetical protein
MADGWGEIMDVRAQQATAMHERTTDTMTRRQRAQRVYEWLRSTNPHLPQSDKVSAYEGVSFAFGPEQFGTVTLTVVVEVPDMPMPPEVESHG